MSNEAREKCKYDICDGSGEDSEGEKCMCIRAAEAERRGEEQMELARGN